MGFLQIWFNGFLLIMVFLTVLWILSVYLKNASIIDPFWGLGFVILCGYYLLLTESYQTRSWILFGLVAIWGLRLFGYLFWRNRGKGEDYRYQQFRKDYGPKRYWWFSFFQVFLLQGVLMSLVSLPILGALMPETEMALTFLFWPGVVLWCVGFLFEVGGDYQLARFKLTRKSHEVLDTGFWRYSRHPNYFGDATIWWAIGLLSLANGYTFPLMGSLIMNILLLKISGVSLLERNLKTSKPKYEDYIRKTPAFFPWFPKKS